MSRTLTVELSDGAFAGLERLAAAAAASPAEVATAALEQQFREPGAGGAAGRAERHFGSVDLGRATGADNDTIDDDLAREYNGGGG